MRSLALASALIFASASLLPVSAEAAPRHHRTMSVTLSSGRVVKFHMMRMGGQMMLVAPLSVFGPDALGG